jgi:hypothetical protein
MAKYTIEELYRGDKYSILSAVGAKAIRSGIDPHTADGQTWLEMELIRQTFITAEKMKQNGDCISDKELGDAVALFDAEKLIQKTIHAECELGVMAVTVTKRALKIDEGEASILIDSIRPFVPQLDTVSLELMRGLISNRMLTFGRHEKWIHREWDSLLLIINETIGGREE